MFVPVTLCTRYTDICTYTYEELCKIVYVMILLTMHGFMIYIHVCYQFCQYTCTFDWYDLGTVVVTFQKFDLIWRVNKTVFDKRYGIRFSNVKGKCYLYEDSESLIHGSWCMGLKIIDDLGLPRYCYIEDICNICIYVHFVLPTCIPVFYFSIYFYSVVFNYSFDFVLFW